MGLLTGVSDFFGLDIGTTAVRMVHLHGSGVVKSLVRYAYAPLDPKIAMSESRSDQQKVIEVIRQALGESNIATRNVVVGLPSHKVFTTLVDVERLSLADLAKTIRYQADSLIPTPIDESKIDWALVGDSPQDPAKVEILLSSVGNEFVEARLDLLESIGLNVIAFEPDNLAFTRALVSPESNTPQMVVDMGSKSTDIVVIMGGAPRLTRSIPTGTEALVTAAMQNLSIEREQADQFVFKFGLGKDKLEGQIYNAILGTVDLLIGELEKSVKFFESRYQNAKVETIIVTGGASALPEFPLYIANKFGIGVEIGNAWRNVAFPPERQNELLALSNHFGVAAGLAERSE